MTQIPQLELKNKVIIIDASKEYKEGKNQNTLNPESIEQTNKNSKELASNIFLADKKNDD